MIFLIQEQLFGGQFYEPNRVNKHMKNLVISRICFIHQECCQNHHVLSKYWLFIFTDLSQKNKNNFLAQKCSETEKFKKTKPAWNQIFLIFNFINFLPRSYFWMKIAQQIRNYYQNMIMVTQKVISSLKKYKFPKMVIYAFFLLPIVASCWNAFFFKNTYQQLATIGDKSA